MHATVAPMHFPSWIDRERNQGRKARLRLKYMLSQAALHKWGDTSIRKLAKQVPCDHSSIFNAIARGHFTEPMAEAIERVFGRDRLPAEWLVKPLEAGQVNA